MLLWYVIFRAIRGVVRPSPSGKRRRTRPWMLFTLAAIFGLMSLGALASGDEPTCNGQKMYPGDACRRASGTVATYEEIRHDSRSVRVLWGVIAGGAGVGCLILGLSRQRALRDAQILVAHARAQGLLPPQKPSTYDWRADTGYAHLGMHQGGYSASPTAYPQAGYPGAYAADQQAAYAGGYPAAPPPQPAYDWRPESLFAPPPVPPPPPPPPPPHHHDHR